MTEKEKIAIKEELRKEIVDDLVRKRSQLPPLAYIRSVEMLKNPISNGEIVKSPNAGKYAVDYMIESFDSSNLATSKLFRYLESITNGFCIIREFRKSTTSDNYLFSVTMDAEMVGNLSHYLLKEINKYLKNKNIKEEVCHA